jgi:hypothetical protein
MYRLPGMPTTPADVWSGRGVWHVSAIARLLVPEQRAVRIPRPRTAPDAQRAAKTPVG